MRITIDQTIMEEMMNGDAVVRKYICERLPEYFAFYYFPGQFTYEMAPFHWLFFNDFERLMNGELDEVAWIAFRESAKTTIAKIMVCHAICFKKQRYINWDSYDKDNAKSALFDIATWLQTNEAIINDFGYLFKKKKGRKKDPDDDNDPSKKALGSFITENKIKVEAFSTQEPTRGRLYSPTPLESYRPGLFILDDIETSKTKDSFPIITSIIKHIDEMRSGLSVTGVVLILGNYLTEEGVIAYLENIIKGNPTKIFRKIAVKENDKITWPGKYVETKQDAIKANLTLPREQWKVSIEKKREDLTEPVFQREMMNNPGASGDYYFDRNIIRGLMAKNQIAAYEPKSNVGGFKLYADYRADHRYAIGADTAEGIGADSNASVLIDFSCDPPRQIGSYENNQEGPDIFAHALKKQGETFGACWIVPEINNTGYATVSVLLAEKYYNMYVREVKNKTTDKMQKEYGFRTGDNKSEILAQFKSAVEDGKLEIMDGDLLKEMYHYTKSHLRMRRKEEGMTRHFDKLMAACLAWEGRHGATLSASDKKEKYKAPAPRV